MEYQLQNIPGYRNYFLDMYHQRHLFDCRIAAYNGIYCGDSCIVGGVDGLHHSYRFEDLGSIMLFNDQYRPSVDLSRAKIQNISLEMACDIFLIQERLIREGYSIGSDIERLLIDHSYMISTYAYQALLRKRPDLVGRLIFNTDDGDCGCEELKQKIEQSNQDVLYYKKKIFDAEDLGEQLKLAYLKLYYDLRMSRSMDLGKVYIRKKTGECRELHDEFFPPSLFFYPETDCRYLMRQNGRLYGFCNADHRLSRFLLRNAELLQKRTPGILRQFIRTLLKEDGEDLVSGVNALLDRLRSLPGQSIQVPADLFLTMEDFYPEGQSDEP